MAKQAKYKKSFDSDIKFGNNNFQKILKFYLFECPTPGKSRRGTTFEGFGWQGTKQFSKEPLNNSPPNLPNIQSCIK